MISTFDRCKASRHHWRGNQGAALRAAHDSFLSPPGASASCWSAGARRMLTVGRRSGSCPSRTARAAQVIGLRLPLA